EPAGEHDATLRRHGALEMQRIVLLPRQVDHVRDGLPLAEQHRFASANTSLLPVVQLDEIRTLLLGLADEDRDTEAILRYVEHGRCAPRARLDEDEAEHVGSGVDRDVDVLLAGQTA